jgi:hypothetical protein
MNAISSMKGRASSKGLTFMEVVAASAVSMVLGYALIGMVTMGNTTQATVSQVAEENDQLRTANKELMKELQVANSATMTITTLQDNNHEVTFMTPVEVSGNPAWGVRDFSLGPDPTSQTRENWKFRYTVQNVNNCRKLVRQILDDMDVVQREEVIAENLRSGSDNPPGFQMVQAGEMWELTIGTLGEDASDPGRRVIFHVLLRN